MKEQVLFERLLRSLRIGYRYTILSMVDIYEVKETIALREGVPIELFQAEIHAFEYVDSRYYQYPEKIIVIYVDLDKLSDNELFFLRQKTTREIECLRSEIECLCNAVLSKSDWYKILPDALLYLDYVNETGD